MENNWHKVLATHEEEQDTALFCNNRYSYKGWPGNLFPGVALPCKSAIGKWIILRYGEKLCCAQVADVGPWCIDDESYVFGNDRPRAEKTKGRHCDYSFNSPEKKATVFDSLGNVKEVDISNGAGIDLFPYTAKCLGIAIGENVTVEWKWAEP